MPRLEFHLPKTIANALRLPANSPKRQQVRVLKETVDPEEAERAITKRMNRLAQLLSEMGEERVILNKAAVVGGRLPDITERVEERLKESDGK